MIAKEKEEAKAGTTEWTIWVNFPNLDVQKLRLASSADVADLFVAIRERFKLVPLDKLIVHTKDADNKLLLLDNAELELADALKCDSGGKYRVYVEVPKVEAVAGLCFSGLNFTTKLPQEGSLALPFQNREPEITTMARVILENFGKADECFKAGQGAESQFPLTLLIAAQMLGSGKTTFGQNFLSQLRLPKFAELTEDKASGENVHSLLSLEYVMINLRQLNSRLSPVDGLRSVLLEALLQKCSPEQQKTLVDEYQGQLIINWPCPKLVRRFSDLLKKNFFLHFDEADRGVQLAELPRRLYDFWNELYLIQYDKNVLFFTGRSPVLYLLGRGYYRDQQLVSPNSNTAKCVLLDALKVEHVTEILNVACADSLSVDERKQAAEIIIRRCSGVPRLVAHAVRFLKAGRNSIETLAGNDFLDYLGTAVDSELNQAQALEGNAREIYIELIRLSSLGVPFDPLAPLERELFGFPARTFKLEICASFPVYLEKVNAPRARGARKRSAEEPLSFRLVIPEVMLRRFDSARLPFWRPVDTLSSDGPTILEDLTRNCIRLRISEELGQAVGKPLQELMPFFTGSLAGAKPARFVTLKSFPKISNNPNPKSEAQLKQYWDTKDGQDPPFAEVNPEDKGKLLKFMESGMIYHPKSKSSSSDIMYVLNGAITEWQCKFELEPFTIRKLEVELSKTFEDYATKDFVLTFVVVAFNVHEELTSMQPNASTHLYFKSGTKLTSRSIPKHVDVIVLLKPGLSTFLTSQNVEALETLLNEKHSCTLEKVARAIQSPFKSAQQTSGH